MKLPTKFLIAFYFSLFFYVSTFAQTKELDSLKNLLKNHTKNDTIKANLLNNLSYYYSNSDIEKAQEKAQEALDLCKKLNYKRGEAYSLRRIGSNYRKIYELQKAKKYMLEAMKVYEEINDELGVNDCKLGLAAIAYYDNDIDAAIAYCEEALAFSLKNGDLELQASILGDIGTYSFKKGNMDKALIYLKKSSTLSNQIGAKKLELSAFGNIAAVYNTQGKYLEALNYLKKCLVVFRENGDKRGVALTCYNMSASYYELQEYEKTLSYLDEALQIARKLKNNGMITSCLINKGAVYADLKEFPKALDFMKKSIKISKEMNNETELSAGYFQLGSLYILMEQPEMAIKNNMKSLEISTRLDDKVYICHSSINLSRSFIALESYSEALQYALKGKKIADDLALLTQQKLATEALSTIYNKTGNYKKAFENHQLFKELNDSLFNKENIQKLTALEYEYKYQKERDSLKINELQLTKTITDTTNDLRKSKRNLLYGIIIFLVAALLMGSIIFFLKLRNEKAKTQNAIVAQKLLRSQMTPHFIFNSLSVLQGMILHKEEKNSVAYLSKFSKLLRTILENSRHKTVLLSEELAAIDDYMVLQNLDEIPPYKYILTVAPEINTSTLKIPPMLIQPFIENAIEHAFPYKKENKKITVTLSFENEKLICIIEDNGIGINIENQSTKKNAHKNSLATTITSERLKTLSKDLKKEGSITIKNKKSLGAEGTLVTLVIPYLTEELEPLRISLPEK